MMYFLVVIPLVIILVFLLFKWLDYNNTNKSIINYKADKIIFETKNMLVNSLYGYVLIVVGSFFIIFENIPITNFIGTFIMATGYQVFLMNLGIQNEILGNKLDIDRRKS